MGKMCVRAGFRTSGSSAVVGCIMVSSLAVAGGCDPGGPKEQVISMSASSLWNEYQSDPSSADDKYKGSLVQVSGRINGWLNGQPMYKFEERNRKFCGVHCHMGGVEALNRFAVEDAAKKGERVTIRGRCRGWDGNCVDLDDCRYVR